jgi:hypothetical protein
MASPWHLAAQIERRRQALTVGELADLIHLSTKQVFALVQQHCLPALRIAGSIRFNPVVTAHCLRSKKLFEHPWRTGDGTPRAAPNHQMGCPESVVARLHQNLSNPKKVPPCELAGQAQPFIVATMNTAEEQHYTPGQLAKLWGLSVSTIRRLFERTWLAGDRVAGAPAKRGYRTLRIPTSVAARVHPQLGPKGHW